MAGVLRPPPPGGLEARRGHRAVDLRAYAEDGPLVGLPLPARYQDAARAVQDRRRRLAEHVTVRVRCTGADGRRVLHTIELVGGRLRLADHPAAERRLYQGAPVRPPRCVEVLAAWRNAAAYRRRSGGSRYDHHDWRSHYDVLWLRHPDDQQLPPALRTVRRRQVGEGALRADYRDWLGQGALETSVLAGERAVLPARLEYARVRPALLLEAAPARLEVSASSGSGSPGAVGATWDEHGEQEDEGHWRAGISLQLGRDWLRRVYWRGLAWIDHRLVLDVDHDPSTGRPVAVLVNWARQRHATDTTGAPGELGITTTGLHQDAAGRWHLADPLAGTTMHLQGR